MDQAPDSPTGLVTRLQGWLLPEIAENTRGSPGNVYGLQRIIGRKQTYAVSPGGKNSTSLLAESDIGPEDVLHFWFGGDMKVNYKTKWFPDGSSDTQKRADEVISKKFGELFCKAINGELSSWKRELRSTIALLLVYDQFSRHIYRLEEVPDRDPKRMYADGLALETAEELTNRNGWDLDLCVEEFVFSLMPFRHTPTADRLTGVLVRISSREATEKDSLDLLLKFRKQTIRRLQQIQDIQKASDGEGILEQSAFTADESDMAQCDIVGATEDFLRKHMKTLKDIVRKEGKHTSSSSKGAGIGKGSQKEKEKQSAPLDSPGIRSAGCSIFRGPLPVDPIPERSLDYRSSLEPVAISLSGGVDSMVIAKILVHLCHTEKIPIGRIVAMHIDYANREESAKEAQFVREWCLEMGIECHVRVVSEVTRGVTSRDEYERISRDIRYEFYGQVLKSTGCAGVIFGHHSGDVEENVISNVMRGTSPLSLSGMTEAGVTNGVHVWRPLLAYPKSEILAFAHKYGVPYFKDSTPSWSTRGKLRTQLMPLLLDMYGEGCARSLRSLAQESDELADLVTSKLYEPFLRSVERHPCGLCVDISPYFFQPLCFWRAMLKDLMHSMGMSMVRERSVKSFLERIQCRKHGEDMPLSAVTAPGTYLPPPKSAVGWLELRKGFHTMLTGEGHLIILRDGVLSSAKKHTAPDPVHSPEPIQSTDEESKNSNRNDSADVEGEGRGDSDSDQEECDTDAGALIPLQLQMPGTSPLGAILQKEIENECGSGNGSKTETQWVENRLFSIDAISNPNNPNTSSSSGEQVIHLGAWRVTLSRESSSEVPEAGEGHSDDVTAVEGNKKKGGEYVRTLQTVRSLLEGEFSYHLSIPVHCQSLGVRPSTLSSSGSSGAKKKQIADMGDYVHLDVPALNGVDPRLKQGIPLLVPVALRDSMPAQSDIKRNPLLLRLVYHYLNRSRTDCSRAFP